MRRDSVLCLWKQLQGIHGLMLSTAGPSGHAIEPLRGGLCIARRARTAIEPRRGGLCIVRAAVTPSSPVGAACV